MKHAPVPFTLFSLILSVALVARWPARLQAQVDTAAEARNAGKSSDRIPFMESPYAGKFEPRIGGWIESEENKLRLDIGTAVDLWKLIPFGGETSQSRLTLGTEFFTWTRLRSAGRFKFPVEAVDYYFGVFGHLRGSTVENLAPFNAKLRVAHISAHLVDGDSAFFGSNGKPVTYSREFVDVRVGLDLGPNRVGGPLGEGIAAGRLYAGGVYLFSTIPDTLGRVSPYAGLEFAWQLRDGVPLTLRAGYEARLNTELEPIGEHSIRVGLKLAETNGNGVVLEGAYYSGRSPYGQYFSRRERYFSLGFSVEH